MSYSSVRDSVFLDKSSSSEDLSSITITGCTCHLGRMPLTPQATFVVRKVRENEEKYKQFNSNNNPSRTDIYTFEGLNIELSPTKYSSKYMNSIWGMYNRYSVHNLKKIMDDTFTTYPQNQQKYVGSS